MDSDHKDTFSINHIENAIDSLETALSFLSRQDDFKWKWVGIALHHSLYSFSISSIKFVSWQGAIKKGGKVIGFWEALRLLQDPKFMGRKDGTKVLKIPKIQEESLNILTGDLRNTLVHTPPGTYVFGIQGIVSALMDILDIIECVCFKLNAPPFIDTNQPEKTKRLIAELRESLGDYISKK